MRFAHAFAALAVAACLSAAAAVPEKVSYQGYLTSPSGVPVNTTVSMTLKLYDALTGGNLVWSDTQSVVVANGVYNVVLGSDANPLDETVLNGPRYLTVAVGGDTDMTPRTPLASAPYAILAKAIDGTLPVENGGTGLNTIATGGLIYGQGTSAAGVTGAGSLGQVLTATAGGVPQWSNSAASLLISHPGPGPLTIQSGGSSVGVQGVTFDAAGVSLGSGTAVFNSGVQILGAQQTGITSVANATGVDSSTGSVQVVSVTEYNVLVARVNQLLERLRNHGLISLMSPLPAGSACNTAMPSQCESTLCVASTCAPPQPDGSACAGDAQCTSARCIGAICQAPLLPPGSACSAPSQCASSVCGGGGTCL